MKFLASVVLTLAVAGQAYAGTSSKLTPQLMEARNAAAGFAGSLKFAVGRGARECRDALGKDDTYMKAIVDDWLSRNGAYSKAAESWVSLVLTTVANNSGPAKAQEMGAAIFNTVQSSAQATVDGLIGTSAEEHAIKCQTYPDLIHSGKLDITPSAKLYPELQELVGAVTGSTP
jgi:hypothetical protein